jgi:aspartyl-tRNA(Asn)/glutamyl-tRNA(Gln) amidotransferase subunit C
MTQNMFTTDDVKKIAKLSRLHLDDDEIEHYRDQLGSILEYVAKLQEVDTTGVPELQHAVEVENVFRADEPSCDPEERRRAIEQFSAHKGDLLEVQAVFEGKE